MQRRLRIALIATAATGALALGAGTAFAASPADDLTGNAPQVDTSNLAPNTGDLTSSAQQLGDNAPSPDQVRDQLGKAPGVDAAQDLPKAPGLDKATEHAPSLDAVQPGAVANGVQAPALPGSDN